MKNPLVRPIRLRTRGALIAATVTLQAMVLGVGGYVSLSGLEQSLSKTVERGAIAENARTAENFARILERELEAPFQYGSKEWDRVQTMLERQAVPRGAYLVLLDANGDVLCHPQIRDNQYLRNVNLRGQWLKDNDTGELITLAEVPPRKLVVGSGDVLAGQSTLAAIHCPRQGVTVLLHQPHTGLTAASATITGEALAVAGASGAALLLLTMLASVALFRRYDSVLEEANKNLEAEVVRRTQRGLNIRNGLIFGLAKLADYRDTDTGKHLERICAYAVLLAQELRDQFAEIDDNFIARLGLAASMHDIGKVGIPDGILLKPGALTQEERRMMESHATIGADTLVAIRGHVGDDDLLNMGIQITLSHHERWDGQGYPFGLAREEIPLAARIVAIADVYDALTSRRVYKPAYPHEHAAKIILESTGTHFDPRIVAAFSRLSNRFKELSRELVGEGVEQSHLFSIAERARELQEKQRAAAA